MTLISIITVNYNDVNGLGRTVRSVQNQSFSDFEHIVIDGDSTDGSKAFIEDNSTHFSHWISERDKGIYDAMNKGIAVAKGEYVIFLNSGDDFSTDDSLMLLSKELGKADFIYANINVIEEGVGVLKKCPDTLSFKYLYDDVPPHQATFIRRNLFNTYGQYDISLKIVADWKFFILAVCKYNATYLYVDTVFSNFYIGGVSSNMESMAKMNIERQKVLESEFSVFLQDTKERFVLERTIRNLKNSRKIKWLQRLGLLDKF